MTRSENLNNILYGLFEVHRKRQAKEKLDPRLTFAFIAKAVNKDIEEWEINYLKETLINDGYIKMGEFGLGEPPQILQAGINFIIAGGYTQKDEELQTERLIKKETLVKFKYDKWSFLISIISLIIALIAIFKK